MTHAYQLAFVLSAKVINHRSIKGHLGSQGSNYKQLQMTKVIVSCVGVGQTCISVHGDLFVRPTEKGSKVKKGQITKCVK